MLEKLREQQFVRMVWAHLTQKNRMLKLILCIECVFLILSLFFYFWHVNHLLRYSFDADQLAEFTSDEFDGCFGGWIDESYEAGWYDIVPGMFLKKGLYQYDISYECIGEEYAIWLYAPLQYHNSNIPNPPITPLGNGIGTISEEVWVNTDMNASFHINHSGNGRAAIMSLVISETPVAARMSLFLVIAFVAAVDILIAVYCYFQKHAVSVQGKYIFAALVLTAVFSSYPLFVDYAIEGHDFIFHLNRIEGIKDGWLSGQFPVRINPTFNNGYGYASPIFYGEIFLYIPAFLRLVGFPLENCYNIYLILINVLTCFGGYYCFRKMFRSSACALAISVIYTMSPYRLTNLYLRSALGEFTAMAFYPFVVYGMYCIYTKNVREKGYRWCFLPLVVGLTGIIQSHILSVEMVGLIIMLVCVLLFALTVQKERFSALVKAFIITVCVNLWFLVPLIDFSLTQNVGIFDSFENDLIQPTGLFFTQLLSLFQKYAKSVSFPAKHGIIYEMPLTLGMPLVLGVVLCAVMFCVSARTTRKEKRIAGFLVAITVIVTWMSTIYFPWDGIAFKLPFLRNMITSLQFSWRYLAPATVLAAVVTGIGLMMLCAEESNKVGAAAGILLCVLTVLSAVQFMQEYVYMGEPVRISSVRNSDLIGVTGVEYSSEEIDLDVITSVTEPRVSNGEITAYVKKGTNVSFIVLDAQDNCFIQLPLLNYKGYKVNSEDGSIANDNLHTGDAASICIDIPEGFTGRITVRYQEAWYWRLAEAVSVLSVIIMSAMIFREKNAVKINGNKRKRQGIK